MKILITTHHLKDKAGSELFTRDLSLELKKRGHEIFVFSPTLGEVSEEIKQASIMVSDNLLDFKNQDFDIIHAQHNVTAILVRSVFPHTPMVFMSHGVLPELEQPPSIDLGIYKFLAVSEEVESNLIKQGISKDKVEIIRNFVDTQRFKLINQPNDTLRNILVLSNHYSEEIKEKLETVSNKLNLNIVHVGLPENSVNNVEDYINKTDLVITLGRGALESMSCGRNVLVYDIHGADGIVSEGNFFEIRKSNFSGRKYSLKYTNEDLEKELSSYSKKNGLKMRELILKENSIDVILSKLEGIYLECVNTKTEKSQIQEGQLFNEINFLERCFNNLQYSSDLINKSKKETEEIKKIAEEKETIITEKEEEMKDLKNNIFLKENEINALKNSTSWKITKPVRAIVDLIKKIIELIKLSLFVLRNDGPIMLLKKINKFVFKKIFRLIKNKYLRIVELFYKSFLIIKKEGLRVFLKKTHLFLRGNKNKKNLQDQYEVWIKQNEDFDVSFIEKEIFDFKYKPKISVITPVYNVDPVWLDKCIESVLNQFYQNWELCLHDDASTKKETIKCLKKWEKKDPRIKISYSKVNQHISGASNEALKLATGEFIALLDNDDELAPHALFENVKLLNDNPQVDFIYSDKDKIDDNGFRFEPFFKPDFSPEIMLSANYLTHLNVIRKKIIERIGGWGSTKTDGAQDWDIFLKIIEVTDKIKHLPKVLYHWRVLPESTSSSILAKPYAIKSQEYVLDSFFNRNKIYAKASVSKIGEMNTIWDIKKLKKLLDFNLVIITNNYKEFNDFLNSNIFIKNLDCKKNVLFYNEINYFKKAGFNQIGLSKKIEEFSVSRDIISILRENNNKQVVFINTIINKISEEQLYSLLGWTTIKGVGVTGGVLVDNNFRIVDFGSTYDNREEVFFEKKQINQSTVMGHVSWSRNLDFVSRNILALSEEAVNCLKAEEKTIPTHLSVNEFFDFIMSKLRFKNFRNVVIPSIIFPIKNDKEIILNKQQPDQILGRDDLEKYGNKNAFSYKNIIDIRVKEGKNKIENKKNQLFDQEFYLLSNFDADLSKQTDNQIKKEVNSVGFFLPEFDTIYAGIANILKFSEAFIDRKIDVYFYISDVFYDKKILGMKRKIVSHSPKLKNIKICGINPRNPKLLNDLDLGICSLWTTAYILLKLNIPQKAYFIQDYEPLFYPGGITHSLAEQTYGFNFYGIANTPGLLNIYREKYKGQGTFVPSFINLDSFFNIPHKNKKEGPFRIFFYGRPEHPRNGFSFAIAGLKKIKEKYKEKVEIFSAGAEWREFDYEVEGIIKNLGKIPIEELPAMYGSMDIGIMFMYSGHPGVVASELMAAGVPVIVNLNDDIVWRDLYVNKETCLMTKTSIQSFVSCVETLMFDVDVKEKLVLNSRKRIKEYYGKYQEQLDRAMNQLLNNKQ